MTKGVIIQGSARSDGNTHQVCQVLSQELSYDLIDLKQYDIGGFDYEFKNTGDDFLPLFRRIVEEYEVIIFVTPVYWYSMSGIMKNFIDRISDCLKIEKETGRKLRGKRMASISCGSDEVEVSGFSVPFKLSAEYLGMEYLGHLHTWDGDVNEIDLSKFFYT